MGIVLTMDGWLTMGMSLHDDIFSRAREATRTRDPGIAEEDCRPIAFVAITDLELALRTANESSFVAAMAAAAQDDRRGYMFTHVHDARAIEGVEPRPYPFSER